MMLPHQTFFQPTEGWWRLLRDTPWLRWRRFIDVGAGMGHLADAMVERDLTCRAVDLHDRPGQSPLVEVCDAMDLWLEPDDCAILARPAHGDGLHLLLRRLIHQRAGEVLYVGKPRNVETDLEGMTTRELARGVGEEDEVAVWVVADAPGHADQWCLIDPPHSTEPEWWINGGDRWVNAQGGGWPKSGEEPLETRWLAHEGQLYRTAEEACDRGQTSGWIDPDGLHLPASYGHHERVLEEVHGITARRAEEAGFVRVHDGRFHHLGPTTEAQRATLRRLGMDPRRDGVDMAEIGLGL